MSSQSNNLFNDNVLNTEVSLFANATDNRKLKDINLYDYLTIPHPMYLSMVEAIRSEGDKDKRLYLKKKLPAITPSGIFDKRNVNGLINSSIMIEVILCT